MIDRLAPILLLAGCVVFGTITIAELRRSPNPQLAASAASPAPEAGSRRTQRQEFTGRGRYTEMVATILARPLFNSTRRPPPRGGETTADTGLSDIRLTGIVTEPGRRIAIFAPTGAKLLTVTEGDNVSGWRVDSITPQEVALSGPEGTKTLQPKFDPNLAPPPPPSPPPSAANAVLPPRPVTAGSPVRPGFPPPLPNRVPRPGQRGPR